MGGLQAKSMTSQRNRAEPSQDGGYALLWQRYDNNKLVAMRYYGNVILHLQQYSHRLNLLYVFLRRFHRIGEKRLLASQNLSVRPSSWNYSATTGRIFIKFDI